MTTRTLLICNSRSATLSVHELTPAGEVVRHSGHVDLPVPSGENIACPMAISADHRRLYLAWRGSSRHLLTFSLEQGGLRSVLMRREPISDDICFLHFDAEGRRLLAAGGDAVIALPLGDEGIPGPGRRAVIGPMAHAVIAMAGGDLLATTCRGDALVRLRDDGGALAMVQTVPQPKGSGPRHLCADANGRFVYLVSQESGEVVVFTGESLEEVQRVPMVDDLGPDFAPMGGDIAITPDGRHVLATERNSNRLVVFAVSSDSLHRTGWVSVPDYPRAMSIDPGGRFVTVLGFRGHEAALFGIGAGGELTPLAGFATGERPSWALTV